MKNSPTRGRARRAVAAVVIQAMLFQGFVAPVFAAVSQSPAIYIAPPTPNLMFTLDDSGSMTSDAIPDFEKCIGNMPHSSSLTDTDTNDCARTNPRGNGSQLPSMWKSGSDYLDATYYDPTNAIARYMRSSAGNPLYYNPMVRYRPWVRKDNDTLFMDDADPGAVNIHTSDPTNDNRTINLKATRGSGGSAYWPGAWFVYKKNLPALPPADPNTTLNVIGSFDHYILKSASATPTFPASDWARTDCASVVTWLTANPEATPAEKETAIPTLTCAYAEELKNFANWLQYYRSRMLMTKGGTAAAFSEVGNNLRVGFTTINAGLTPKKGVAVFAGTERSDFYELLYEQGTPGSTPLRQAMDNVGKYFSDGVTGQHPWSENTAVAATAVDSCRRSFHILSTDGFWNGSDASSPANNNNDNFSGSQYTPYLGSGTTTRYPYTDTGAAGLASRFSINPYNDNNSNNTNTLADVAAYYWRTDLLSGLANSIAPTSRDPAFWQHLTTFTVGLGISGTSKVRPDPAILPSVAASGITNGWVIAAAASYPASSAYARNAGKPWLQEQDVRDALVADKVKMIWTKASGDEPETGDDLIHASMNGHGRYLSAVDPSKLSEGLRTALAEATNNPGAMASLGTNTGKFSDSNVVYQATYNPYGWTGRVYAFPLRADGSVNSDPPSAIWEVSKAMPATRSLYTWNPAGSGALFSSAGLTTTQKATLGPDVATQNKVLDWLRGGKSNEPQTGTGGTLRDRVRDTPTAGVLGDIVGGSPVKGPNAGAGYDRLPATTPGQSTYATYRSTATLGGLTNMRNTLFFGANDGMLHGVNTANGEERFGFVPNSVFSVPRTYYQGSTRTVAKLKELSDPGYTHLFTVDGEIAIGDVHPGTDWKTMMLATTGAGARSIFAIDVTNPGAFGTGSILWELSSEDTPPAAPNDYPKYMGHIIGGSVAKLPGGNWVALFGNGYDSAYGQAALIMVDLATRAVTVIGVGNPGTTGSPATFNGLSRPNFRLNNNRELVTIYAGDLLGNLWKFDVNQTTAAVTPAFGTTIPLWKPAAGKTQPITVRPELTEHTAGGYLVSFGTGKLFDVEDMATGATNVNLTTQSIYGVWDKPGETTGITGTTALQRQTITGASRTPLNTPLKFGGTSVTAVDWATQRGWYYDLPNAGQRVFVNPSQVASVLLVVTDTPSTEICGGDGTGAIIAVDPLTGKAPAFAVFDSNNDGSINSSDLSYNILYVEGGVMSMPSVLLPGAPDGLVVEDPFSRGQTSSNGAGVEDGKSFNPSGSGNCNGEMIAGKSDPSVVSTGIQVCSKTGRVTWRQIK